MPRREVTGHEVENEAMPLRVYATDVPSGGACHEYRIDRDDGAPVGVVNFHRGPVDDFNGVNGVTDESMLIVLADRLRGLQSGQNACKEFSVALRKIEEALESLRKRRVPRLEAAAVS